MWKIVAALFSDSCFLIFFLSNSLVAEAQTIKCGKMECPRFKPQPLPIELSTQGPCFLKFINGNRIIYLYYPFMFSKFLVFNVIQVSGNVVYGDKLYKEVLNKVWLQFTSSSSLVKNVETVS